MTEHKIEMVKAGMDLVSVATIIGVLADVLPALGALLTCVWTIIRIAETETVRKWLRDR